MQEPITTPSNSARTEAIIIVGIVAIITLLNAGLDCSISTSGCLAVVQTSITVVLVAIVAFLGTVVIANTVTTSFDGTVGGASITVDSVAIITVLMANPDEIITATSRDTRIQAIITVVGVAIIALLVAGPHESISTAGKAAVVRATVVVVSVSVIALLNSSVNESITTASSLACVGAVVSVESVAIITLLSCINDAVSTARTFLVASGIAAITIPVVAVITLLRRLQDTIATTCANDLA